MNGTKLKELRLTRGWSQQELAVQAGLHVMTVARVEQEGHLREPALSTVRALARALGISTDELLAEPEPDAAPEGVTS